MSLVSGKLLGGDNKEGFHRDNHKKPSKKGTGDEEDSFSPLCVFPDIYLTYDIRSISPKKKAPMVKKLSEKSSNENGIGKKRPASARKSSQNLAPESQPNDTAPKARGLVGKHYKRGKMGGMPIEICTDVGLTELVKEQ